MTNNEEPKSKKRNRRNYQGLDTFVGMTIGGLSAPIFKPDQILLLDPLLSEHEEIAEVSNTIDNGDFEFF
jgi:hypothetical protein